MGTESYFHKIRVVQKRENVYGVTIPASFKHWFGLLVSIKESGNCLILESGSPPEAFTFKDIKQQGIVVESVKI